ncbi:MAG: chitobiase/beta-hexosaminidase C-terminal domain-containing protein [Spirochaetia bacterium]
MMKINSAFFILFLTLILGTALSGCHRPLGYFPENRLPPAGTEIPDASDSSTVCQPEILCRTAQSSGEPVPVPGEACNFHSDQVITFSCATEDAELYYTLDGADPDPAEGIGTLWDGETGIELAGLGESLLIKVIGVKPLMFPSCVVQSEINITRLAAPSLSVQPGTYPDVQTVTVTCGTEGAEIYYTDDGTEPDAGSLLLPAAPENSLTVDRNTTLKFIALKEHCYDSDITSGEYRLKAEAPDLIRTEDPLSNFPTVVVDIP